MVEKLKAVINGGGNKALDAFKQEVTLAESTAPMIQGRAGQALRGLGLVVGVMGQVEAWER